MKNIVDGDIRVTVSGSFKRSWEAVKKAIDEFNAAKFEVLSPKGTEPDRTENGFVFLRGESGEPDDIERHHLAAIARSHALYIVASEGYVGRSVALEIGYALALGVPVWGSELIAEVPHRDLVEVGSVTKVIAELRRRAEADIEKPSDKLRDLQRYYGRAALRREGFSTETPEQVLILLVEEVGELAKAMRTRMDLSMREDDTSRKSIRLELADCFIYLLHMANQTGYDLYTAFLDKERLNEEKRWLHPQGAEQVQKQ
jgi:NTP pyrophosphatase (non-canonical NTP hydrolase)